MKKKLSETRIRYLLEYGLSHKQIAKQLNVAVSTLKRHMNIFGIISPRRSKKGCLSVDKIIYFHDQGFTKYRIAKETGVNRSSVTKFVKRNLPHLVFIDGNDVRKKK